MSRTKGNGAEREVAKIITAWWSRYEQGCKFVRTPLSGGWSAGPDFEAAGDLMTSSKEFPFCVEVKRRESFSWRELLAGRPSPVWDWWRQTVDAAAKQQANEPILWFRKNREKWWILLGEGYADKCGVKPKEKRWTGGEPAMVYLPNRPTLIRAATLIEMDPLSFARKDHSS